MDFQYSDKTRELMHLVKQFRDKEVLPAEKIYEQQVSEGDRWQPVPIMEELKKKAKQQGLWNFFLPDDLGGAGLSVLEYAPLSEIMGYSPICSETMNCSAPDTGNMEVLARFGTEEQKERWLKPLLEGEIRSAFIMTEPEVASSDATNISATAVLEGDEWVINGRKWFSSGMGDPRCRIMIVMVRSNPENARHLQHSQILVPAGIPGLTIERPLSIFNYDDAPHGHMEIVFDNVRVPKDHCLLGPGRGFEIAQARLGPGRIHHCMRTLGVAERALELMCKRGIERVAFGKQLVDLGGNVDIIAEARMGIEMGRLLTLNAAQRIDLVGAKEARSEIAQIKVAVPRIALNIIDQAIQMHGAAGVTQDTPLAKMYASARTMRIVDGPDAVHLRSIGRDELTKYR